MKTGNGVIFRPFLTDVSPSQAPSVIQQRGAKNIAGRILTPTGLKTVNSIQPVSVTTAGSIQIGNNVHNITAVQSLLSGSSGQAAAALRMKAAVAAAAAGNRRNVVVGGIQSVAATIGSSNGQSAGGATSSADGQSGNCAKLQTMGVQQQQQQQMSGGGGGGSHLSAGELQTLAGTLTAAPTIGTIQLTRNVQTLPAASVHLVTSNNSSATGVAQSMSAAGKSTATLNSIQLNAATAEGIMAAKGQKVLRLSSGQDGATPTSVELPMSALSALLSGMWAGFGVECCR